MLAGLIVFGVILLAANAAGITILVGGAQRASDEEQIRTTADRFTRGWISGDGDAACEVVSEESKAIAAQMALVTGGSCEQMVVRLRELVPADRATLERKRAAAKIEDIVVNGDQATVKWEGDSDAMRLVREDGEWRVQFEVTHSSSG